MLLSAHETIRGPCRPPCGIAAACDPSRPGGGARLRFGFDRADDEESDLDLLVDPSETTSLFTLAGFKADAEELLGVPVSVLTPEALPPKFRSEVLQQARPL